MNDISSETGKQRLPRKWEFYLSAVWVVLFLGCFFYLKFRFGMLLLDDAYITMSHVRTFVETGQVVMSQRNPVNATSTPLFTLLLSGIVRILGTAHFEGIIYLVNVLFDLIIFSLLFLIARTLKIALPLILLILSAVGFSLGFIVISASGMESMLYASVALTGIYGMLQPSPNNRWLVAAAFFAPLVRPEGILVSCSILIICLYKHRTIRAILSPAIAAGLGFLLFFLFYCLSYGSPLPHSVTAKKSFVDIGFSEAVIAWINGLFFKGPVFGGRRIILIVNLLLITAAVLGYTKGRRSTVPLTLLLWPVLYIGFFFVTGTSDSAYPWYYFPVLPVLIISAVYGISKLNEYFRWKSWWLWGALFFLIPLWTVNPILQELPEKYKRMIESREGRYKKVAALINTEAKETETILCYDVGVIGYYCKPRVLDAVGLLSPEVIPWLRRYGWNPEYYYRCIDKFKPEWALLIGTIDAQDKSIAAPEILEHDYKKFGTLLAREGTDCLEIWRRVLFSE